jgi:MFS transporter, DHA2 family, multidrug resistance protein
VAAIADRFPHLHPRRGALGLAVHSAGHVPALSTRPWIGILAVLMGAFISVLNDKLSAFGLSDIRGALHVSVDEGAWIPTALTVGQMLICPLSAWLGAVYGPRRVLFISSLIFAAASLLLPFSGSLRAFLLLQFIAGLASGTFIPLTIGFVLQNLPPKLWSYGVASYALSLGLSLYIPASLEGWYVDHASWHWIFWQSVPLALVMASCIWFGIPRRQVAHALLKQADWFGMTCFSMGASMIYAALQQGNRLDWFNSGLVTGLMSGGAILLIAFFVHERLAEAPWLNLGVALSGNLPLLFTLIVFLHFTLLSTGYIIPNFLWTVQGYRSLQTGQVLLFVALPQLLSAPLAGFLLRRIDARLLISAGFALVIAACWLTAKNLTPDWTGREFLAPQIMQALGQSFGISGVVFFAVLQVKPADALTFGTLIQTMRLLGGELGSAFMSTFVRIQEQTASALLGLHVQVGDSIVDHRIQAYAEAVYPRSPGLSEAYSRALDLLSSAVRKQAHVLSYIDGFAVVAFATCAAFVVIALLSDPPANHPALPRRRV